jgi:hypothetical protein
MKNWKTTSLGLLTILSVVISSALNFLKTGALPGAVEFGLLAGGWGLVQAKDNNVTNAGLSVESRTVK